MQTGHPLQKSRFWPFFWPNFVWLENRQYYSDFSLISMDGCGMYTIFIDTKASMKQQELAADFFKGYSKWAILAKMPSMAQKLKFQKTCRNRFYNHIRVVLCKKPLQKPPNIQLACWLKVIGNTNSAEQRFVLTELGFVFFLNVSEAYVVNRGL